MMIFTGKGTLLSKKGRKIKSGQEVSKPDVDENTWDYLVKGKMISEPARPVEHSHTHNPGDEHSDKKGGKK